MWVFLKGLSLGLLLSVMVGPIFFTILQSSIERGRLAGFALAFGQWIGDFLYIGLAFLGAAQLESLINNPESKASFTWYVGGLGGVLLLIFGAVLLLTRPPVREVGSNKNTVSHLGTVGLCLQGLLINTINPFPLFFWASLMATAISNHYTEAETVLLYGTVMGVIILTDLGKVYLAGWLSQFVKEQHLRKVRNLAGWILVGFGILLFWQTR